MTCEVDELYCGEHDDGCGGTLRCGTCGGGALCGLYARGRCDACYVEEDLGSTVPLHRVGRARSRGRSTEDADAHAVSLFEWSAPRSGAFVISKAGSEGAVRMWVSTEQCAEVPVPGPTSAYPHRYELEAGQRVFIGLTGSGAFRGGESQYQLRITEWVGAEGRCADRTDDDGDGAVDCADPDCQETPECRQGSACADVDLGTALPVWGSGPSHGLPDAFEPSCGGRGRSERVHLWTAPRAGRFVFHPGEHGSLISLWSGCRGKELACAATSRQYGSSSPLAVLVRELAAGESLLLLLEGWGVSDTGHPMWIPSSVLVHEWVPVEGEGLCEDGRDNDADGFIDSDDRGCPNHDPW